MYFHILIIVTSEVVEPSATVTNFEIAKNAALIVFDDYVTPSKEFFSRLKWLPLDSKIAHSEFSSCVSQAVQLSRKI